MATHAIRISIGLLVLGGGVFAFCWALVTPGLPRNILGLILLAFFAVAILGAVYAVGLFFHYLWRDWRAGRS